MKCSAMKENALNQQKKSHKHNFKMKNGVHRQLFRSSCMERERNERHRVEEVRERQEWMAEKGERGRERQRKGEAG